MIAAPTATPALTLPARSPRLVERAPLATPVAGPRFTVDGSDDLERHLARICEKIAAGLRGLIPPRQLEAVLLGGGYGRGEGGVLRTSAGDRPYNDLEFARAAAGFQGSSLSPLGAAYLMTLIARGGAPVGIRLHEAPADTLPAAAPATLFSARTAQRLTRMLEVTIETGTCRHAFTGPDGKRYLPGIRVAGKTGTLRPEQSDDTMTSWFVGFAPSRNPEIVVSVMLVNGHTYRRKANELARDLLRTYFRAHGHAESVTDPFNDSAAETLAAGPAR